MIPHASLRVDSLIIDLPFGYLPLKTTATTDKTKKKELLSDALNSSVANIPQPYFWSAMVIAPLVQSWARISTNTCSVHWYIGYSRRWSWHWWSQIQGLLGWPTRWHASGRLRTWVNMADAVSIKITRIELQPWSNVLGRYQPPSPPESMLEYQLHTVRNGHQLTPTLIRGEGEGGGGGGGNYPQC